MPYKTIAELPKTVSDLPTHAKEIYMSAFNSAIKDNDEEASAKIAWSAVKEKYKKEGDKWVSRESMGMEDKRTLLQQTVDELFTDTGVKERPWLVDVFDDKLVCQFDGSMYEVAYTISEDGIVTLGDKKKVRKQTTYVPIEALRGKYTEVVNLAGSKNIKSKKVNSLIESCHGIFSGENQDSIGEVLAEADSVLAWLKEQSSTKEEDGVEYPSTAFAYVPDKETPSTWKLRMWEDSTKKVTKAQLGRAAAALSPGGFRGQKVEIPKEDLPAVKRKIRSEYRKLEVEDEDIPKWVKESESRIILDSFISLEEASVEPKGIAKIVLIRPGWGNMKDKHYYPAETLARDYSVFEGAKMFADHQTDAEEKSRPEGSIKEWVASLKNVKFEEGVGVVGDAIIIEPWMEQKLARLKDKGLLSEMGTSIRAVGTGTKGKIDGKEANIVERIIRARSVDFVTEPGAGGTVLMYESESEIDVDIINLNILEERRPDLIKEVESKIRTQILKEEETKMELEERVKQLETDVQTVTQQRDDLQAKVDESDKAKKIAEAKSIVDQAVSKSTLPEAAKNRILDKFKESETADGIEEAIKAEQTYIEALNESGKVKNLGDNTGGGTKPGGEEDAELEESFKGLGLTDEQAKIAAKGR